MREINDPRKYGGISVVLCIGALTLLACSDPCEIDGPIVFGGFYTAVSASADVTVVTSAYGLTSGDKYSGIVHLYTNVFGGAKVEFGIFGLEMPSRACIHYEAVDQPFPIDGSIIVLECNETVKSGVTTLYFFEDSNETMNPALGIAGRFIGEVQSEGEEYTFVLHDFYDERAGCEGDNNE